MKFLSLNKEKKGCFGVENVILFHQIKQILNLFFLLSKPLPYSVQTQALLQ